MYRFERVQWTELKVGDIVAYNGSLEEVIAIKNSPKQERGKCLFFGSGYVCQEHYLKDRRGEFRHHIRLLRASNRDPVPLEIELGRNPNAIGVSDEEIVEYYRRGKASILKGLGR